MDATTATATAVQTRGRRPRVVSGIRRGVRALGAPGAAANAAAALTDAERAMARVNERLTVIVGADRP